jgi:hypothetical protein
MNCQCLLTHAHLLSGSIDKLSLHLISIYLELVKLINLVKYHCSTVPSSRGNSVGEHAPDFGFRSICCFGFV